MTGTERARPLKVLYVVTKSNFGGAQRYVFDLACAMRARGHEVLVALGGTGAANAPLGALHTRLVEAGIRTRPVSQFMRDMSPLRDIRALFELVRIMRDERPDVVHASSSKAGGLALCAARCLRVRTRVFTAHGLTFDETWRSYPVRSLIWLFTWFTVLLSTTSILITRDNHRRVAALPGCKRRARYIQNGIQRPEFVPRADARTALMPAITDDLPWIGSVAEYHPNKNLGVLIEAVAKLRAQGTDTHLVLIGQDGGDRPALEALIEQHALHDRVHLIGSVPNAARLMRAFNIVALPSRKEGLPYVLIEAGFAGVPVVASDLPGIAEIIADGTTGMLLPPQAQAYAAACRTLLTDRKKADALATALTADVEQRFSLARMVEATEACYASSSNPSISRSSSSRRTDRS